MSDRLLAEAVYKAQTGSDYVSGAGSARLEAFAETFDAAAYRRRLDADGLRWIDWDDPAYPERLRAIHEPPRGLFVRGSADLSVLGLPSVAVVGARACTPYGEQVATGLSLELSRAGVVVVSGLARGVDAAAHRAVVEGGGVTVAVLGCGVDRDYPAAHAALARRIVEAGGLVVSEYAPGVEPAPWRFPARNRIVAGLTLATVVVEARERSGSLITADLAREEGRVVLAVPGETTSACSIGTNDLLRRGTATIATCADDILYEIREAVAR